MCVRWSDRFEEVGGMKYSRHDTISTKIKRDVSAVVHGKKGKHSRWRHEPQTSK